MCVLLERKIEEDTAPVENRKRSPKVGSHVLKSTQGKKNYRTHGKEQVFTVQRRVFFTHLQEEAFPTVPNSKKYQ